MAIVSGGTRFGPFDIRGGISRGDFKSSAYHKTDKDPRFKQRSEKPGTIGVFRAAINSAEGFARPNKFAIRLYPPSGLAQSLKGAARATLSEGSSYNAELEDEFFVDKSSNLQNLNALYGRQVNVMCENVVMPGVDLQTQDVKYGTDVTRNMVTGHGFEGNIVATFYADKYLRERQYFEMWQKLAVNTISHKANYYDNYIGTMEIYQLDGDGEITYGIKATEVYPSTIAGIEYAYANTNQIAIQAVQFQYRQWYNLTSDEIAGYSKRVILREQDIAGRRDNAEFDSNARFKTNAPLASKNSERKRLEQLRSPEIDRQDRARDSRKRQAKRREQLRSPEVDKKLPNTSFQQEIKRQQQLRPPQVDRKFGGL